MHVYSFAFTLVENPCMGNICVESPVWESICSLEQVFSNYGSQNLILGRERIGLRNQVYKFL